MKSPVNLKNISGIYGISNLVNGKIYIGKSLYLRKRFNYHEAMLKKNKHPNAHLQSSFNKYGEEAFEFRVFENCQLKDLPSKEQLWVNLHKGRLYNHVLEVENCESSWAARKRMSLAAKTKGSNNPFFGKKHTNSSKRKMSLALKEFYSNSIHPRLGKRHTNLSKKKMSLAAMGRQSPMKDKNHTEKSKQKMRGSKCHMTKLTDQQVLEIKNLLQSKKFSQGKIAKQFNVADSLISRIKTGTRRQYIKLKEI